MEDRIGIAKLHISYPGKGILINAIPFPNIVSGLSGAWGA